MTGSAFKRREFAVKRRRQGGGSGGREPVAPGFHQRLADLSWGLLYVVFARGNKVKSILAALGVVLVALGKLMGCSWLSWSFLGRSWIGLGRSWGGLGVPKESEFHQQGHRAKHKHARKNPKKKPYIKNYATPDRPPLAAAML